jgi:RHS repeat-associated protein
MPTGTARFTDAPRYPSAPRQPELHKVPRLPAPGAQSLHRLPRHQQQSTNVVTDASGTPLQNLDYYPYGSTRVSQQFSGFNEQKQYIGQYEDPETNLSYLMARYYDGSKGEFLSEDPVFWGKQNIPDPQSLNSPWTTGSASKFASASGLNGNIQPRGNSTSGWSENYLRDPQQQCKRGACWEHRRDRCATLAPAPRRVLQLCRSRTRLS